MTELNGDPIGSEDSNAVHSFLQPKPDEFLGERAMRHLYKDNYIGGQAKVHFGDQNIQQQFLTLQIGYKAELSSDSRGAHRPIHAIEQPLGLCLDQAPYLSSEQFIGRENDIQKLHELIKPAKAYREQRRVVLGGVGGVGKTQLALAYAKRYSAEYESIFWMNATSDATMKTSLQSISERMFESDIRMLNSEQLQLQVKRWLSDPKNSEWLLIFDNYDEPEAFDIQTYLPQSSHGAVIFTTRLPNEVSGSHYPVRPLRDLEHSLQILETRSQRQNIKNDVHARRLAAKLAGLPLALATAGAYLCSSAWTFETYLQECDSLWATQSRPSVHLTDYQETLYTTWDLSYKRLKNNAPQAAGLLRLLAYFDHKAVWYELLRAGKADELPEELRSVINNNVQFDKAMSTLVSYCFIEVQKTVGVYGMHSSIHDWTLESLNANTDLQSYCFALSCVDGSIPDGDRQVLTILDFAQFVPHASRLTHRKFENALNSTTVSHPSELQKIAKLLLEQRQHSACESVLQSLLSTRERMLGSEHSSTLDMVRSLGLLYYQSGELSKAEEICMDELTVRQKTLGPDHISTLETINNLGKIYTRQERLEEAEKMVEQASASFESLFGPEHVNSIASYNNLGRIYRKQGKLEKAEAMMVKSLAIQEKVLGPEDLSTLDSMSDLGYLCLIQGQLKEAETLFLRAIKGVEKILGREHLIMTYCAWYLGVVYQEQDEMERAEKMFLKSFAAAKKLLGWDDDLTQMKGKYLTYWYQTQDRFEEAHMILKQIQEYTPEQSFVEKEIKAKIEDGSVSWSNPNQNQNQPMIAASQIPKRRTNHSSNIFKRFKQKLSDRSG